MRHTAYSLPLPLALALAPPRPLPRPLFAGGGEVSLLFGHVGLGADGLGQKELGTTCLCVNFSQTP